MNWWEWVFSGIGVLGIALLIEWLRRRSRPSEQQVGITAKGAKVSDSPVASGSGIIQNVNSPTTIHLNVQQAPEPALPRLDAEIREVCFDDVLDSLTEDWVDFTLERYIFVRVWIVNTESVATAVKEWKLTYSKDGQALVASEVGDFSKWRQHVKWKERGTGFITGVIKEAHNTVPSFPSQSLQQGIPCQGWVCFKATGVNGRGSDDGCIELSIVDSFGQEYRLESRAPFACKGDMVNPELPW